MKDLEKRIKEIESTAKSDGWFNIVDEIKKEYFDLLCKKADEELKYFNETLKKESNKN